MDMPVINIWSRAKRRAKRRLCPAEYRVLFSQFGLAQAVRLFLLKMVRDILDRGSVSSYGQTGEDRIINSIFDRLRKKETNSTIDVNKGFYVDVGCFDPQRWSNTFELYRKGWCGINIDANPAAIKKFRKARPNDISICAVVSDRVKDVLFTEFDAPAVSSICEKHVKEFSQRRKIVRQRQVTTKTLNEILEETNAPSRFEMLSIDVEGHDFEVLSSLDLASYRPRLIVIEMLDFDPLDPSSNRTYRHLADNGYTMVGYYWNGFFVDSPPELWVRPW